VLNFLKLEENKINFKLLTLLIIIAYIFNIAVRYIYISYVGDIPQFQWNGHLMINNNDGYYWAEGARDILANNYSNELSPVNRSASILTAFLAKFLPFIPFDVLIEFLPGFLGALVVIPVILIGRVLGSTWVGFLASLLSGMAWSYYHRTMFGYYDTDMLVIVLSTFAVWAVIFSLKNKEIKFFFLAPFIEIFMVKWHGGLFNIANGIFILSLVYILLFDRKDKNLYIFLLFLTIPLLKFGFLYDIGILGIIYFIVLKYKSYLLNHIKYLSIFIAILYFILIGMPWIKHVLNDAYFTKTQVVSDNGFKYFSVVNTVSEASKIPWNVVIDRIAGSYYGFFIGLVGYILLLVKFPYLIVSLPMVGLGVMAHKMGLRFTIFAVPFFSLGMAYIAYLVAKLSKYIFKEKIANYSKYIVSFLIMAIFIYPNYKHIHIYIMPTVFDKSEVEVLDKLKHIANRNDYVLAWWDYGYPIRYYADVKTLIDGGKHVGSLNFPVSFALTRNLLSSRNMAVLDVYVDKHYKTNDPLKEMMKMYKFSDVNLFLDYLSTNIKLPKVKENIYYYLPYRMFKIFSTVAIFSNIDLKTGKIARHMFANLHSIAQKSDIVVLNNRWKILLNKALILIGNQAIPIKRLAVTYYDKYGHLHKIIKNLRPNGVNVIYMKNYNKWLVMDDFYFNSTYIQLFVFENSSSLFEPVILTPLVKIYKVKK